MTPSWQPIDTAPKDGTAILLWPYGHFEFWNGAAEAEVVLGYCTEDEEWFNPEARLSFKPTHWMPLPEPPEDIQS